MTPEISKHLIPIRLMEFVNLEPSNGVNRFKLEGADNGHAHVDAITGLFEHTTPLGTMLSLNQYICTPEKESNLNYLSRIMHMTVPAKYTEYKENEAQRLWYGERCTKNGLPIVAVLFGTELDSITKQPTDIPFVQLCVIRGMTPHVALKSIQNVAKMYLADNN